jgi:membrane-bound lytic murein transglycosylase D
MARHLNLKIAELRQLNPALRHPVFRGQKYVPKGYRLRLPYRNDKDWEILLAKFEDKFYKHYQKKSRIYTVQRGDTAGEIARIHGVKLADLIAANNLNSRSTIYVNQNLRIPLPDEKPILVAKRRPDKPKKAKDAVASQSKQIEKVVLPRQDPETRLLIASRSAAQTSGGVDENMPAVESKKLDRPIADQTPDITQDKATKKSPENPPDNDMFVANPMVESLPVHEERNQLPVEVATVGIESKAISPLPAGRPAAPANDSPQNNPEVVLANLSVKKTWNQNGKQVGIIRVEVEETLGHYAEWLNVSAREIRRLNGFRYGRALHLNQKIKIPLHRVTREEFVEKRFEHHQELAEDFFASYRVERVMTYSIKKGDNIWTLSYQEFEVPLWLIKRYNAGVDFSALIPSQKLLIPIIEKNV